MSGSWGRGAGAQRRAALDVVVVGYLAVLVVVAVQLVVFDDPGRTVRAAWPYAAALAVYLAVRVWRRRGGADDRTVLVWLGAAGVAVAVWLLVAFLIALPSGFGDPSGFYTVKVRVTSPIGDHNTAAGLLAVPIVACAVLAAHDRRWDVGLAVCALGFVACLSRGAAVVLLLVAVAGWWLIATRSARWRLLAVAVGSLAAVIGLAAWLGAAPTVAGEPDADVAGLPDAQGPFGTSIVARADLVVRGAEVGVDHPVLGVGFGRYVEHTGDIPPPNHHAHNLLTHALAEGGVLVALVAAALPLVLAVRGWRLRRPELRAVVLLGGAAIVLHAQHDMMGGLVGYEVLLAFLLAVAGPAVHSGEVAGRS